MSRMKSALETVLVPGEPLLKPSGNGYYVLNPYYRVTTDIDIFNQTVEQAKNHRIPSKRLRALMTAATTYRDLQIILSCGRQAVYSLLRRKEFKTFKVGGCYRISKSSFGLLFSHCSGA